MNSDVTQIRKTIASNHIIADKDNIEYMKYLRSIFEITNDYQEFMSLISKELVSRYGILDWAYSMLDLPDQLTILDNFGTVDTDYISEYLESNMHEHDLLLHHTKMHDNPCFQSDLFKTVTNSDIRSYNNSNYIKLYHQNVSFGFGDICCIPIRSSINGNRSLLSVTSRGIDAKKFKYIVNNAISNLTTLATVVSDIGLTHHKKQFLSRLKSYTDLTMSQPLLLLSILVKHDLTLREGATFMDISYFTAKNHIKKIKDALGAKTIHGAHERAIKHGFIT